MNAMDHARLQHVVTDLEQELRDAEMRVSDVRTALQAVRKLLAGEASTLPLPLAATATPNGKSRPPMKNAVRIVMFEAGNDGFSLNTMCAALMERGWVGVTKDGHASKATVRGTLLTLQKDGLAVSQKPNGSPWAESTWFLTDRGLRDAGSVRL